MYLPRALVRCPCSCSVHDCRALVVVLLLLLSSSRSIAKGASMGAGIYDATGTPLVLQQKAALSFFFCPLAVPFASLPAVSFASAQRSSPISLDCLDWLGVSCRRARLFFLRTGCFSFLGNGEAAAILDSAPGRAPWERTVLSLARFGRGAHVLRSGYALFSCKAMAKTVDTLSLFFWVIMG